MKRAFTLLELVFVVVIIGLLANFGTSLLMTTYTSFTASTVNNRMQVNTDLTLKQISNRLRYRVRGTTIQRSAVGAADITPIQVPFAGAGIPRDLEWIGIDVDGLLGSAGTFVNAWYQPTWSGFINIGDAGARASNAQPILPLRPYFLESPGSNFAQANTVIQAVNSNPVAGAGTGMAQAAIFFVGENSNVFTGYGWQGAAINTQFNVAAHPVAGAGTQLIDSTNTSFSGVDIYERYELSWTAYSISLEDWDGDGQGPGGFDDLVLRYDYQPWNGQTAAANGTARLLLTNVDTWSFRADGDVIGITLCVNEDNFMNGGQYSLCEEISIL